MAKNYGEPTKDSVYFAEVRLSKDDKADFEAWTDEVESDLDELVSVACREGYRFTVKYDYNNNCFSCSTTQQDTKHKNAKTVLISRGGDAIEPIFMNLYKIYRLFPNDPLPLDAGWDTWG